MKYSKIILLTLWEVSPTFYVFKPLDLSCELVAAAAKSLQSCLTLCDPIDGSSPGSPDPGSLQARTLEWVAISFSNASKEKTGNSFSPHEFWCFSFGWQWKHLSASGSAEWSLYPLQSLNFNMPWQEFRVEIRNEALCALGKLTQQAFW